jgi:hypothetical protein
MSLRVIHGKPGSGKSCFCVSLIVKMLDDWARYKIKECEVYPRVLYTNIPLDIDEVNKYLTNEICTEIDLSDQIEVIDDTFFRDKNNDYREWWLDFSEAAFVVIDEVHHYLPAGLKADKAGKALAQEFVNYISTHRHRQHDLIFLTQHLNNITPEVKRMSEVVYEVLNIKNMTFGIWPFVIQMSDIDTVREAFGFPVQLAHIKRGVCAANSVEYDKVCTQFVLNTKLFSLYKSHTLSNESLDRPSLKLGRIGSIIWLFRRYFFKFAIYSIILITLFVAVKRVLSQIPNILSHALVGGVQTREIGPSTSASPVTYPSAIPSEQMRHYHTDSAAQELPLESSEPTTADIIGFIPGGVITRQGILKKDDHIMYKGERDFIKQVDVMRGILYLGSGKKVQK